MQTFPHDQHLLPSTLANPNKVQERTEKERHEMHVRMLEGQILSAHPALVELVKSCLRDDPHERPSAKEVLAGLQKMRQEVEGESGGGSMNLDVIVKVNVAKEMRTKDKRIAELCQLLVRSFFHG